MGAAEGYRYSEAMQDAGSDGGVWDNTTLDYFLAAPRNYIDGTSMVFRGIRDANDRSDLIAYIGDAGGGLEGSDAPVEVSPELAAILQIEGDHAYGAYLSSECTACHRDGGEDIPAINGLPRDIFAAGLVAYRDGSREHQVMNTITARLGDEEIAALAAYFESAE